MADILAAFAAATGLNALNLAGILIVLTAGLAGVITLAWVISTGREARGGAHPQALQTLMLVITAFIVFLIVIGVLYD